MKGININIFGENVKNISEKLSAQRTLANFKLEKWLKLRIFKEHQLLLIEIFPLKAACCEHLSLFLMLKISFYA